MLIGISMGTLEVLNDADHKIDVNVRWNLPELFSEPGRAVQFPTEQTKGLCDKITAMYRLRHVMYVLGAGRTFPNPGGL